jgi:preprotein translocase subunit SecD
MTSKLLQRLAFVLAVVLVCIYGVIGIPSSWEELESNIASRINLGLDLRGGTHLILQVQVHEAIRAEADQEIGRLREDLRNQDIPFDSIERNDPLDVESADSIEITITGIPSARASDFRASIDEVFTEWIYVPVDSSTWKLNMRPAALAAIKGNTVTQAITTIENRVNGLGLTEPTIQQHGRADAEYEILVQLPGVSDSSRVMGILQMTALLEIQEVIDGPYLSRSQAISSNGGILPPNSEILSERTRDTSRQSIRQWYVLKRTPVVTGRDLRNAQAGRDPQTQQWETSFTLSREAGVRFGDFTGPRAGQGRLSVVLDNRIINVATIQDRIQESGRIMGLSGQQEAVDLALVLRAGSLPASVKPLEQRTVGASLGTDSIRQGVHSALLGMALVILLMLIYYRKAGVNAVVALCLNLIILMAVLSYFGFTLTLPGIAGIILTIGMAVDANVLIFERIREELRTGKAVVAALNAGFGKAMTTIVDANLTTIIAAAFLFAFGRGPVRGFAVTLAVGLMANLFTSVFVSRLIFDLGLSRKQQVRELSI